VSEMSVMAHAPVSARYGTQDCGDAKQNHHDKPLESATCAGAGERR
jgi:hypothetical protein